MTPEEERLCDMGKHIGEADLRDQIIKLLGIDKLIEKEIRRHEDYYHQGEDSE